MSTPTKLRVIVRVLDETGAVLQTVQKDEVLQGYPTVALAGIQLNDAGAISGGDLLVLSHAQWLAYRLAVPLTKVWDWIQNALAERSRRERDSQLRELWETQQDAILDIVQAVGRDKDAILKEAVARGILVLAAEIGPMP